MLRPSLVAVLVLLSSVAQAGAVRYEFSGTSAAGDYTGWFTLDASLAPTPFYDLVDEWADYVAIPPAALFLDWGLTVGDEDYALGADNRRDELLVDRGFDYVYFHSSSDDDGDSALTYLYFGFFYSDVDSYDIPTDLTLPAPTSVSALAYSDGVLLFSGTPTVTRVVPIPLPAAAWTGLGLLGALGVVGRLRQRRRP
jgi:hypothetical protein